MPQTPITFLFRGGLNLTTPDIAQPSGTLIAAVNYEADFAGYGRLFAFERFDGQTAPSSSTDPTTVAALRAAILAVPGTGPVNGVVVYDNHLYAIRAPSSGSAGLYRNSSTGWELIVFTCKLLNFDGGSAEWAEGEQVTGGTSGATAIIKRYVQVSGDWGAGNNAVGYIVIDSITGTFQDNEALTTATGAAVAAGTATALNISGGGKYTFVKHNFFGPGKNERLYMANGETFAYEYDAIEGWIAPIKTGVVNSSDSLVVEDDGDFVVEDDADNVVISEELDKPTWIEAFVNHLFLGYRDGSVVNSGIGEPLQYRTTDGASTFSAASATTGLLATTTSLIIGGNASVEYLTGQDVDTFDLQPITTSSGLISYSMQRVRGPTFLDDNGIRALSATADFGDWRMGSLTQPIYPLIKAIRDRGSRVACTQRVGAKDQYRLFYDDGTGFTLYVGVKQPEAIPFMLPIMPYVACVGEITEGEGDRYFLGGEDGYVYETNKGTSFDGAAINAYVRFAFNSVQAPSANKRFHKAIFEMDAPDAVDFQFYFGIDYFRGINDQALTTISASPGTALVSTDTADVISVNPVTGILDLDEISGIGRNIAITLMSSTTVSRAHTLHSATLWYSPRGPIKHG